MRAGIVYIKVPISEISYEKITDNVEQLKNSIRCYGLLQPVGLVRLNKGYKLIFGRKRVKACTELKQKYIHAVLLSVREDEEKLFSAIENLHRANDCYLTKYVEAFKEISFASSLCLTSEQFHLAKSYLLLNSDAKNKVNAETESFIPYCSGDSKYFMRMCQAQEEIPSAAKEKIRLSLLSDQRIFINEIEKILILMRLGGFEDAICETDDQIIIKKPAKQADVS